MPSEKERWSRRRCLLGSMCVRRAGGGRESLCFVLSLSSLPPPHAPLLKKKKTHLSLAPPRPPFALAGPRVGPRGRKERLLGPILRARRFSGTTGWGLLRRREGGSVAVRARGSSVGRPPPARPAPAPSSRLVYSLSPHASGASRLRHSFFASPAYVSLDRRTTTPRTAVFHQAPAFFWSSSFF